MPTRSPPSTVTWLSACLLCLCACDGSGDGPTGRDSVASVRIDMDWLDLTVGERAQLYAVVDANASQPVKWRSTDDRVAQVDGSGGVLGIGPGNARVLAEVGSAADTVDVVVVAAVAPGTPFRSDQRPYTATSPWNTPIPANAPLEPRSEAMVAGIARSSTGTLRSDPDQYAYPVYFADAATPRVTLTCSGIVSVNRSDGTRERMASGTLVGVPIPPHAMPSAGSDAQIIVIDLLSGDEYDIFRFQPPAGCENVTRYVQGAHRSAVEAIYTSRGAGVPYLAGLVRPWEIEAGRIEHALAFGYSLNRSGRCVWPASKTDGKNDAADAIPEGARLRLDPAIDLDQIPGLDRTGRIIARALQEYGAFVIDNSGGNKIYVEDNLTAGWGARLVASTVSAIPVAALQILRLPDAYWADEYRPTHGGCVR